MCLLEVKALLHAHGDKGLRGVGSSAVNCPCRFAIAQAEYLGRLANDQNGVFCSLFSRLWQACRCSIFMRAKSEPRPGGSCLLTWCPS